MSEFKDYVVTWTDIYDYEHKNHTKTTKQRAEGGYDIPRGDILKRIDKVEEVVWNDDTASWAPKPKPYAHSKVPVYEGDNIDFIEYSSEFVPNQGEMTFEEAHDIAVDLLKNRPDTVLNKSSDGNWWVGKMDPVTKQAYFQGGGGVNEPEPKKKKYKSDKAIVVQPRFKEPFYHNYDVYETEGVDGPPKLGPGAGWHHIMDKYKSIKDFLDAKRKHMKNKYKAEDSWIEDTESNKKERIEKMKTRAMLLSRIIKNADHMMPPKEHGTSIYDWKNSPYQGIPKAPKRHDKNHIDFPIDDQIGSGPILGDSESYNSPIQLGPSGAPDTTISPTETNLGTFESYPYSAQIGGLLDKYLPHNDFEDKTPAELDFGRDYTDEGPQGGRHYEGESEKGHKEILNKLIGKYLNPAPNHGLFGLPDGVDLPDEDLGDPTNINPDYGTTDVGITMYEDKWNI